MGRGARTKGFIKNMKSGRIQSFLYNPAFYTTGRDIEYSEINSPGSSYPKFQYVGGRAKSIGIEIFLYGHRGEPKNFINFLNDFLPREDSNAMFRHPPLMMFAFGTYIKQCILESYQEEYLDFNTDLTPRVVVVRLSLKVVA